MLFSECYTGRRSGANEVSGVSEVENSVKKRFRIIRNRFFSYAMRKSDGPIRMRR